MGGYKLETNNTAGTNRVKEQVLVGTKVSKHEQTLATECAEALKALPLAERKAYATLLRNAGWTFQSIATPINLTRESIRLYTLVEHTGEVLARVQHLPIQQPPTVEVFKSMIKKVQPDPAIMAQLKELQPKANSIRGKTKKYREEAELYTKLIYELMESGVSVYRIAKELGVTHSALAFRLVRYGYTTSNGKSRSYRQLTHRSKGEETNA